MPASPEVRRSNESPSAKCGRCGYDLTGLAKRSRCPECGARNAGGRVRDADSLARSSYSTIVGVIWRAGVIVIAQIGFLVVAISIIRTFPVWFAIPAAAATVVGVISGVFQGWGSLLGPIIEGAVPKARVSHEQMLMT